MLNRNFQKVEVFEVSRTSNSCSYHSRIIEAQNATCMFLFTLLKNIVIESFEMWPLKAMASIFDYGCQTKYLKQVHIYIFM